ncbi:hypothetical protein B0H34DRAFT_772986 [Crassisporium funariophilum]|nr:hypothetical protein B0H34DRAFT_772986 [Crassisporium funariophilum]
MWSFDMNIYELILLFCLFSTRVLAIHIPEIATRNLTPRMCQTNVTLPSYPENCFSTCEPIRHLQKRCNDMIPCMCHNVQPASMSECLQCIMNAAGDLLLLIPDYLDTTSHEVAAYTEACSSIVQEEPDRGSVSREVRPSPLEVECGSAQTLMEIPSQPIFLPSRPKYRSLFPVLSIVTACVVLFVFLSLKSRIYKSY